MTDSPSLRAALDLRGEIEARIRREEQWVKCLGHILSDSHKSNAADHVAFLRHILAALPPDSGRGGWRPTEAQIKHMVDRFLGWKLPENFTPDGGISFKATFNEHMPFGPMKHEPIGTNLFDATQADAMVRHMVEKMPPHTSEEKKG